MQTGTDSDEAVVEGSSRRGRSLLQLLKVVSCCWNREEPRHHEGPAASQRLLGSLESSQEDLKEVTVQIKDRGRGQQASSDPELLRHAQ